jgi:hypothetical protein
LVWRNTIRYDGRLTIAGRLAEKGYICLNPPQFNVFSFHCTIDKFKKLVLLFYNSKFLRLKFRKIKIMQTWESSGISVTLL